MGDLFNDDINLIINNSLYDEERFRRVITDEVLENLKIVKYSKTNCKNDKCPILCVDFNENDDVIVLDCSHCFDPDSIKKWLKQHKAECPVCRYKLESIEIRVQGSPPQTPNVIGGAIPHNTQQNMYGASYSNTNFRDFQNNSVSELIDSLYRSYNLLSRNNVDRTFYFSQSHPSQQQQQQPQQSILMREIIELEDFPFIEHTINYDVDFFDFVESYQQLFNNQ